MKKIKLRRRVRKVYFHYLPWPPLRYYSGRMVYGEVGTINSASFAQEYIGEFIPGDKEHYCGECEFYVNGCTTSQIERKFGNARTPACSEFKSRL